MKQPASCTRSEFSSSTICYGSGTERFQSNLCVYFQWLCFVAHLLSCSSGSPEHSTADMQSFYFCQMLEHCASIQPNSAHSRSSETGNQTMKQHQNINDHPGWAQGQQTEWATTSELPLSWGGNGSGQEIDWQLHNSWNIDCPEWSKYWKAQNKSFCSTWSHDVREMMPPWWLIWYTVKELSVLLEMCPPQMERKRARWTAVSF